MRFLVDAQLPPTLARWLEERGHAAQSAHDAGLREASDSSIWEFALRGQWIIITKDEDFALRVAQSERSPQVVWLRIGNSTNRVLTVWLESLLDGILEALIAGNRLVEVRYEPNE